MKEKIAIQLDHIWSKLLETDRREPGIYTGFEGILLYQVLYSQYSRRDNWAYLDESFSHIVESGFSNTTPTFCYGRAGTSWFLSYMAAKELIDQEDLSSFFFDDPALKQYSVHELGRGKYDFLFGGLGIAYQYLFRYQKDMQPFFAAVFEQLGLLILRSGNKMFQSFNFETDTINPMQVDLGLAHGISSVLKFCIECYKAGVCPEDALQTGSAIISFLMSSVKPDTSHSFFPNEIGAGDDQFNSRIGWCYGDLSIAFILYQAGITFRKENITRFALGVLQKTTQRQSPKETMIYDAGICHGSAGAAHIYNKMWHSTGDTLFKQAADYWIEQTLDFARYHEGTISYEKYNPDKSKPAREEHGLLEGAAGIGLVLLTYLTGDFSWDYCLMLND